MKNEITNNTTNLLGYVNKCYYVLCFLPLFFMYNFFKIKFYATHAIFDKYKRFYELKFRIENLDNNYIGIIFAIFIALWLLSFFLIILSENDKFTTYVKAIRFGIAIALVCIFYKELYSITAISYHICAHSFFKVVQAFPKEFRIISTIIGDLSTITNIIIFIAVKYWYTHEWKVEE